ncbi:hypothetical protein D3C81_1970920 [compost metagenome]
MNTMRVGAEDGKSLVPVDLAGVGWRRLRCDAIDPAQAQAVEQVAGIPPGLLAGMRMTRVDAKCLKAFEKAILCFCAIDHADAGKDQCLLEY